MTVEDVTVWCEFIGSWLLFMGPLYQAALELSQENELRDQLGAAKAAGPDRVSAWWWLVPPVHYLLQRRRSSEFRRRAVHTLDPQLLEDLVVYLNKANGWLYVGSGGLLIAVAATGQLAEHQDWSPLVFGLLAAVMAFASAGYVAARIGRSRDIVVRSRKRAQSAQATGEP